MYNILKRFVSRYISKGVCLTDKMKIPINEVIDLSNQIDQKIIESNLILTEQETLSVSEESLRTLAYDLLRSRCIRGKELRASFKQLDKVYFLDNAEINEALKSKMMLPTPLCCIFNCKCLALMMNDVIARFPDLIKTKLEKFVVELEVIDKIVINSLLQSSADTSSTTQLRERISRRPLVLERTNQLQNVILKQFVENLIQTSKECVDLTYEGVMKNTLTLYSYNGSTMSVDENMNTVINSNENSKSIASGNTELHSSNDSMMLEDNYGSEDTQNVKNDNRETEMKIRKNGAEIPTNISKQIQMNIGDPKSNSMNISPSKDTTATSNNVDATTAASINSIVTKSATIQILDSSNIPSTTRNTLTTSTRTTRLQGGLFNRIPGRRRTTTPTSTASTTITTTRSTTTIATTTQSTETTSRRRFNPFLRNVFGRG